MDKVLEERLMAATEAIEQQVDAQLHHLDSLDEDGIEALRRKRLENLKKIQQQKQEWQQMGHGHYDEIANEAEFFEACKKSKNLICHFYRDSTMYCKVRHYYQYRYYHVLQDEKPEYLYVCRYDNVLQSK